MKVKAADGYTYYMAKALLESVLGGLAEEGKAAYEILETYTGKDLEYKLNSWLQAGIEYLWGHRETWNIGGAHDSRIQTQLAFTF